ncbi:hypothetical protein ACJ73_03077 [Blastomyces percursus]|uniref:Uncharacterized protein n=1 Tax=Blastomyces percursus TaxID=1658174 RepID=A0A1J9QAS1_9EURO|nr:hypothetical protein ACJ73_03077 [Blastomyces percursus]
MPNLTNIITKRKAEPEETTPTKRPREDNEMERIVNPNQLAKALASILNDLVTLETDMAEIQKQTRFCLQWDAAIHKLRRKNPTIPLIMKKTTRLPDEDKHDSTENDDDINADAADDGTEDTEVDVNNGTSPSVFTFEA